MWYSDGEGEFQVLSAFDPQNPNGSARLARGEALFLFRLYGQRAPSHAPSSLGAGGLTGAIGAVRSAIGTARDFLSEKISAPLSSVPGKVLLSEYRLPMIVTDLDSRGDSRCAFQYTEGGYYLDMPFRNAKGISYFRLAGHTHWTPASVNGVIVDGDSALKELKELIDDLLYPKQGVPSSFELRWMNLWAPISADDPFGEMEWKIWPIDRVRERQSNRRPLLREFTFEFYGLESNRDRAKAEDGFLAGLSSKGLLQKLIDAVPGLRSLTNLLGEVYGTVKDVIGLVSDVQLIIAQALDFIRGVTQFIQSAFATVRNLFTQVRSVVGSLEEGWRMAQGLVGLVPAELRRLRETFPGLENRPIAAMEGTAALRSVSDFLLALQAQPQNFADVVAAGTILPQSVVTQITPGATLEQIASRANVSTDDLIGVNALRYPFIESAVRTEQIATSAKTALDEVNRTNGDPAVINKAAISMLADGLTHGARLSVPDQVALRAAAQTAQDVAKRVADGGTGYTPDERAQIGRAASAVSALATRYPSQPGVLYAGDTLRIPQDGTDPVPSIAPIEVGTIASTTGREARLAILLGSPVTEEDRLFGIDLYLNDDGDLEWDPVLNDLRLERGLNHFGRVQARYFRLPYGALRYAPSIGNLIDLGAWQGPGQERTRAYECWSTLVQDVRVRSVLNVNVSFQAGIAAIDYDVLAINGRRVSQMRVGVP